MFPLGNELSVIFLPVMAPDLQTFLHLLHHRRVASLFLNTTIMACLYWVPFLALSRLSSYLLLCLSTRTPYLVYVYGGSVCYIATV